MALTFQTFQKQVLVLVSSKYQPAHNCKRINTVLRNWKFIVPAHTNRVLYYKSNEMFFHTT